MKNIYTLIFFAFIYQSIIQTTTAQPFDMKVEVLSPTQVKLTWTGSVDDESYDVRMKEINDAIWSDFIVLAPSTNRRINNLKPSSIYMWEVRCVNKKKKEKLFFVNGADFTTFSSCKAPQELTMVQSGLDYVFVNWDENGSFKYEVKVQEVGSIDSKIYFTQNSFLRINNLTPYSEYEVSVSSYCKETDLTGSVYSDIEIFETHSFLQSDFERVMYLNSNSIETSSNQNIICDAKLINTFGQIVSDIKPAYSNSKEFFFDLASDTPTGIYVLQIAGSTCKRYLFK